MDDGIAADLCSLGVEMTTQQIGAQAPSIVEGRKATLRQLDPLVRREIGAAARRWHVDDAALIELTCYDDVYSRTPGTGGHWTMFSARAISGQHQVATLTVAVEFDGEQPVDLRVNGAGEVLAGGCTVAALREALEVCEGPLRQTTPLTPFTRPRLAAAIDALLAPHAVPAGV